MECGAVGLDPGVLVSGNKECQWDMCLVVDLKQRLVRRWFHGNRRDIGFCTS